MLDTSVRPIELAVNPLPELQGEPVEDAATLLWQATDSDGHTYYGPSPLDVWRQHSAAVEALVIESVASGIPLELVCQSRAQFVERMAA